MLPEKILSDLIRLQTVNPPGNELEGALYLKKLFEEAGVPGEVVESEEGRGNFIVRIGKGPKKLLFLSHLDVVPAGDDWDFPPFSGEIKDGMVYGRGALDCKDLMAAQAHAMLQLSREVHKLNGELIFAATADEEAGGKKGVKYLLDNFPEKLQADFAINEGAIPPFHVESSNGSSFVCFVQVGEKGTAWSRITARGKSVHGSLPDLGDNAVTRMSAAINALQHYRPQVKLLPEVKLLLEELSRLQGMDISLEESNDLQTLQDINESPESKRLNRTNWTKEDDGSTENSAACGPTDSVKMEEQVDGLLQKLKETSEINDDLLELIRAMTRMTVSPNVIAGGNKTNTVPDHCEAELDIRILPGEDKDYVLNELHSYLAEYINMETDWEFIMYRPPTFSPADTEAFRLVKLTTEEVLSNLVTKEAGVDCDKGEGLNNTNVFIEKESKQILCLPHISTGSTDSSYLRNAGIPAYGIGIMHPQSDPALTQTMHGRNERTDVKSVRLKAEFLMALARNYLS